MKLLRPIFKRLEEEFEFKIPTDTIYYFIKRCSIRVVPILTTWNMEQNNEPEFVYQLDCTVVNNNGFTTEIKRFNINVNKHSFQSHIDTTHNQFDIKDIIIEQLLYFIDDDLRNKEQFEADLQNALNKISK